MILSGRVDKIFALIKDKIGYMPLNTINFNLNI